MSDQEPAVNYDAWRAAITADAAKKIAEARLISVIPEDREREVGEVTAKALDYVNIQELVSGSSANDMDDEGKEDDIEEALERILTRINKSGDKPSLSDEEIYDLHLVEVGINEAERIKETLKEE